MIESLVIGFAFNLYSLNNADFFHQRASNDKTMNCKWEYVGKTTPNPVNPSLTLLGNVYYKQKCITKENR